MRAQAVHWPAGPFARRAAGLGVVVAAALSGCVVDADPEIAPALAPGDLVVTEVRGAQSGPDDSGQFIELYNASGAALDLRGVVLQLYKLDGSSAAAVIVRQALEVAAGGYVVLGPGSTFAQPPYVDYAMGEDLATDLYPSGAIDVTARGARIDRVVYSGLPSTGSYALGALPPDADANDDAAAWCTDVATDDSGLAVGSPGLENTPCD